MVGTEIKALREAMGLAQVDFAKLIPVNLSTIQTWEANTATPRPSAMVRLEQLKRNRLGNK